MAAGPLALAAGIAGCANSNGVGAYIASVSSGATSLATLPTTTGAVSSGSSSLTLSRDSARISSGVLEPFAASTGLKLTAVSTTSFSGKSRGLCETSRLIRDTFRDGARPDKILCYVGVLDKKGLWGSGVNVYDGANHAFSLTNNGTEQLRFKLNIQKTNGVITSFKGFTCETQSGSMTQDEYIGMSIANGVANITAVDTYAASGNSNVTRATTTGNYGSSGWTSKSLTVQNVGSFTYGGTTNSQTSSATINQGSSSITLSAWMKGNYGTQPYETDVYGVIQGLNMSKLTTFAIGDGSVLMTGSYNNSNFASSQGASWLGDTLAAVTPASSGANYSLAAAGSIPTSSTITSSSIGLSAANGETWDCSGTTTVDMSSLFVGATGSSPTDADMLACDAKYSFTDTNWADCSSAL